MNLTSADKRLTNIAGFLGLVQGLTWAVFALISIVLYLDTTILFKESKHYMDVVGQQMYYFFLAREDYIIFTGRTMTPKVFFGFSWVYLILSALWLYMSQAVIRMKSENNIKRTLTGWSHLSLTICVWDFITVIILGAEYDKCLDHLYRDLYLVNSQTRGEVCANGILTVLVIVARGFVLWIINAIFAIILMKMAKRFKKPKSTQTRPISTLGGTISAYPLPHASVEGSGQYSPSPIVAPLAFQNLDRDGFRQYPAISSPQTTHSANQQQFEYTPVRIPDLDYRSYSRQAVSKF